MKLNKMHAVLLVVLAFFFLTAGSGSCSMDNTSEADKKQEEQTDRAMSEAQRQVGYPNIVNFQQRRMMKEIFEEQDIESLICYAYIKSDYQGKLMFIGKCMGYGVPFSAQFTNPMKKIRGYQTSVTLPQADPNGLFMPTSSSATWLFLIDPVSHKPRLAYFEPEIVVSPFKLH